MTITELYKIYQKHPEINTDTRCIKTGSMFFCLKGNNFNGNLFADEAIAKGAAYVIIDEASYQKNDRYILVNNSLSALQDLALHHRKQLNIPIIGITGTNGKTTTKELVHAVLSKKYKTVATAGNLNNHIGVPLSLLSIGNETEIAIIEMGANHLGEIGQLCEMSCPDYGIITNVGIAHLEGFGNFDNIVTTKKALYDYIIKRNGMLFVNGNDSLLMKLSENARRITYGNNSSFNYYAEIIENRPFVKLKWGYKDNISSTLDYYTIQTNLIGEYNFENILTAISIGKYFKVSDENIKQGLEAYKPDSYRSQFIDTGKNKIIMDAYNANPSSIELAINNFARLQLNNKILILGDMLELGKDALTEHDKIIRQLKNKKFDKIILIGPVFTEVNDNFESFPDSETASQYLISNPLLNKTILIKGSRGIKLEKILKVL